MLNLDLVQSQIKQAVSGSVQGVVNTKAIAESKVIYNEKIANMYSNEMKSTYTRLEQARKENRELVEMRRFLLPMLVNGQISIKRGQKNAN